MILFLYGEDTFRSLQKLKEIVGEYKKKNKDELNLLSIDLEEKGFQEFRDQLRSRSIFNEKKLIILKNPLSNSRFKKELLKNKGLLETSHLLVFYQKGKVSSKDDLFALLKKQGRAQGFKPLKGAHLRKWVKKIAHKYWVEIEPSAVKLLITRCRKDLWRVNNETAKIASWKNASENNKQTITRTDVEKLTRPRLENDIFKTINAIADRQKGRALTLVHSHLEQGESPLYLLSMISWQFTRLLAVKEKENRGQNPYELSWHPYVIKKSRRLTRKFEFQTLKKIHDKIAETDLKIKTGRIEPKLGLELLIAEI